MGRPSGVLQGLMVHCTIALVYSADCCGSVYRLYLLANLCGFLHSVFFFFLSKATVHEFFIR